MSARYIIRFDDIAPGMAWSKFLPLKQFMEHLGIRCLLGVVPACQDYALAIEPARDDFFDLVRAWKQHGDTIVQHGTYHLYETTHGGVLGINSRSEFAGLPYQAQLDKLRFGKDILVGEGVWEPYFMPPSHSFDLNTIKALKALGFIAITDGVGFFPYLMAGMKLVPQLLGRPFAFPFGVITICVHVNAIGDEELERLRQFMASRPERFVSFRDIAAEPVIDTVVNGIMRGITSVMLRCVRTLRKTALGDLS